MAAKDSFDPGWNDPPIFKYDEATAIQAAAATKKGISLNKRVAFPISGNSAQNEGIKSPAMSQPPLTPPVRCVCPPKPEILQPLTSSTQVTETIIKDKLNEVLKNLQTEAICDEEITKRIKIMQKMWTEDKLDNEVKLKILELSEALAKNDAGSADHIQKGLMVDYVSQCSSWMGGIRHLINQKKQS